MQKDRLEKIPITKRPINTYGVTGNTDMWVKDMSQRDTALWGLEKPLWIVDNKVYDLTQFAKIHPGGSSWMNLTKGQDITILFRTHHLEQQKVRKTLQKYYIGQAPIKHEPRFDMYHFQQIRKLVLQKYTKKQLQDTTKTDRLCFSIVASWFTLLALTGYFRSYTLACVCGFLMMSLYGIGHLYSHRKDNHILRHVYILIGFTAKQQQIMHVLSHHPYPNTLLDYEYRALEPIMNYSRCYPENKWISAILIEILFLLVGPINIITKLITSPIMNKQMPCFQYLITLGEILYLGVFCGDLGVGFKLWMVMMLAYGFSFGKMIVCPHRQVQLWSQGAPQVRDYVLHNIVTTGQTETGPISTLKSLLYYAGFNIHVIHHLMPTVDHSKISQVNQIFMKYCKQNGMKISQIDLLKCNKNMLTLQFKKIQFNLKNFLGS